MMFHKHDPSNLSLSPANKDINNTPLQLDSWRWRWWWSVETEKELCHNLAVLFFQSSSTVVIVPEAHPERQKQDRIPMGITIQFPLNLATQQQEECKLIPWYFENVDNNKLNPRMSGNQLNRVSPSRVKSSLLWRSTTFPLNYSIVGASFIPHPMLSTVFSASSHFRPRWPSDCCCF